MSEKYAHNLCRLCLYKSHNLIDIFGENGRHGYVAAEVIKDLLQITVHKYDRFPQNVCSICLDKLTDFKVFKDQCLECKISFEREFCLNTSLNEPKIASISPERSVSEGSIKVEVKAEAEIIEIPADDLITTEISPVPSELDVETIDEDDNILYLESRGASGENGVILEDEISQCDSKGRFLKSMKRKKKKKRKKSVAAGAAWRGKNAVGIPAKDVDKRSSVKNNDVKGHAEILQGLINKARKDTLMDVHNWDSRRDVCPSDSVDDFRKDSVNTGRLSSVRNSNPSAVSLYFSAPEKETHRNSVDGVERTTLRKRTTHPYLYSEDNFLLTGENIQGYADWGRWSPDKSPKKKKKLDVKQKSVEQRNASSFPLKEPIAQRSFVETSYYSTASADRSLAEGTMDGSDLSCDSPARMDHECHICGKVLLTKAGLVSHRKTHPKVPFPCNLCDNTFHTLDKLKTHQLKHSGIRPFGCNICSKAYTRLSHLKRHLLVHTRSKDSS